MTTLTEKINAINNVLRDSGSNAVQKIDFGGQIRYGYRPQYVFDAVNQIISPENWRYELIKEEIFDNQAVAEVKLFLKTDAEWLCKGSHKGQMAIVRGNIGDAQKGAITDALQKCLSLCSIGQDSYRGLLETVFNSRSPQAPRQSLPKSTPQPTPAPSSQPVLSQPAQPATPQPVLQQPTQAPVQAKLIPPAAPQHPQSPQPQPTTDDSLPMIDGISYQHLDSIVVASGKVYDKKELLKAVGFKWNKESKNWYKEMTH